MNKAISLLVLVKSMTKAEKRYLKLYSNLQEGDKVYLQLFVLMETCASADEVCRRFCMAAEMRSFDMSVKHLYKVVMECLTHLRSRHDIQFRIFDCIAQADILFRCGLLQVAVEELGRAKKLARCYEQNSLLLLIRQTELRYHSSADFQGMGEKQLVEKQMKINETLKSLRDANQHMQLYDILKYRSFYRGTIRSESQRMGLNDLVLSELHLMANNSYRGFEVDKLHQLFQSTYFLQSGNYKAAIRSYRQLVELFDDHTDRMLNPPIYYMDALLGVLDSLQMAGLYSEMPFFIARLRWLSEADYPLEFIRKVQACIYIYESSYLLNRGELVQAQALYEACEESVFRKAGLQKFDIQLSLHLNAAILHLATERLTEARRFMTRILGAGQALYNFPVYRLTRLVNLMIRAESGDHSFVESEIQSIRRSIDKASFQNSTERLICRFVRLYPLPASRQMRERLWERLKADVTQFGTDKYERPLLKYFDLTAWIEHRLTGVGLPELLARNALRLLGRFPGVPSREG